MTEPPAPPEPGVLLPVRRAPRFGAFIATGALVGLVVGVIATLAAHPRDQGTRVLVSVLLVTVLVGGLLGALGALAADRRRGPRAP